MLPTYLIFDFQTKWCTMELTWPTPTHTILVQWIELGRFLMLRERIATNNNILWPFKIMIYFIGNLKNEDQVLEWLVEQKSKTFLLHYSNINNCLKYLHSKHSWVLRIAL